MKERLMIVRTVHINQFAAPIAARILEGSRRTVDELAVRAAAGKNAFER